MRILYIYAISIAGIFFFSMITIIIPADTQVPVNEKLSINDWLENLRFTTYDTSRKWAGYIVEGTTYDSVTEASALWTVPAIQGSCSSTDTSSTFWVGLDGATPSDTYVEQAGTASNCFNGAPFYDAWFEMYPGPIDIQFFVSPGDSISASVYGLNGYFSLFITDDTNGQSKNTTVYESGPVMETGEIIAEDPIQNNQPLPLSNWGTVNFAQAMVNFNGDLNFINDFTNNLYQYTMADGTTTLAYPSSLGTNGAFSVTYGAPPPPPSCHYIDGRWYC